MWFQKRDEKILQTLQSCDGVVARRQIKNLFWRDCSIRSMERRLSKLYQQEYINWPTLQHRRTKPIPEPICWLGWKGAMHLAGQSGIQVPLPLSNNENQLRLLQRRLRKQGFHWIREPRWIQLEHDLSISDIRFAVEKSSSTLPEFSLDIWYSEGMFR